ncbi:preprotein translocase subunit SecG [bacterium]|nr:preprotein translocase subunit SecG [bacterium]
MLHKLLWALHIVNCTVLIIVVLLQAGKGSTVGLSFGGGASQTVFGSSGGKNFFARLTSGLAILFMVTSVFLSVISSRSNSSYRGVMRQLPGSSGSTVPDQSPSEQAPPAPVTLPEGQ